MPQPATDNIRPISGLDLTPFLGYEGLSEAEIVHLESMGYSEDFMDRAHAYLKHNRRDLKEGDIPITLEELREIKSGLKNRPHMYCTEDWDVMGISPSLAKKLSVYTSEEIRKIEAGQIVGRHAYFSGMEKIKEKYDLSKTKITMDELANKMCDDTPRSVRKFLNRCIDDLMQGNPLDRDAFYSQYRIVVAESEETRKEIAESTAGAGFLKYQTYDEVQAEQNLARSSERMRLEQAYLLSGYIKKEEMSFPVTPRPVINRRPVEKTPEELAREEVARELGDISDLWADLPKPRRRFVLRIPEVVKRWW